MYTRPELRTGSGGENPDEKRNKNRKGPTPRERRRVSATRNSFPGAPKHEEVSGMFRTLLFSCTPAGTNRSIERGTSLVPGPRNRTQPFPPIHRATPQCDVYSERHTFRIECRLPSGTERKRSHDRSRHRHFGPLPATTPEAPPPVRLRERSCETIRTTDIRSETIFPGKTSTEISFLRRSPDRSEASLIGKKGAEAHSVKIVTFVPY